MIQMHSQLSHSGKDVQRHAAILPAVRTDVIMNTCLSYFLKAQGNKIKNTNRKALQCFGLADWLDCTLNGFLWEQNSAVTLSFHTLCLLNSRKSQRMMEISENSITSVLFLPLVAFPASGVNKLRCRHYYNIHCSRAQIEMCYMAGTSDCSYRKCISDFRSVLLTASACLLGFSRCEMLDDCRQNWDVRGEKHRGGREGNCVSFRSAYLC